LSFLAIFFFHRSNKGEKSVIMNKKNMYILALLSFLTAWVLWGLHGWKTTWFFDRLALLDEAIVFKLHHTFSDRIAIHFLLCGKNTSSAMAASALTRFNFVFFHLVVDDGLFRMGIPFRSAGFLQLRHKHRLLFLRICFVAHFSCSFSGPLLSVFSTCPSYTPPHFVCICSKL